MNPEIDEEIINQSRYKAGKYGFIFRWSPERNEWLKSELTIKDFRNARTERLRQEKEGERKADARAMRGER